MTSLMMFIVILTIGMALVPLLFIEEKEAHTFEALLISPANLRQVVTGKALAGLFYCLSAAAVVILINRYLIVHWSAVILAAVLGAAFSVALGLILGFISDNQATTGLWGGALIVCLIALTVLESLQAGEWPALIQNILHWQPGSTLMRLFQISMAGDVPPGLLWTNAAALLAAAGLVYALFFGMLSRTEN
jgi:ABC-type transport system involved in multi-copper enzyme maturation permease subunit